MPKWNWDDFSPRDPPKKRVTRKERKEAQNLKSFEALGQAVEAELFTVSDEPAEAESISTQSEEAAQVATGLQAPEPKAQETSTRRDEMSQDPQPALTLEQLTQAMTEIANELDAIKRQLGQVDQLNRGVTALHRRVDDLETIPNVVRAVVQEALKVQQAAPQTGQPAQQTRTTAPRRSATTTEQPKQAPVETQGGSVLDMLRKRQQS